MYNGWPLVYCELRPTAINKKYNGVMEFLKKLKWVSNKGGLMYVCVLSLSLSLSFRLLWLFLMRI